MTPLSSPLSLTVHVQGSGYPVLCLHGHPGLGSSMAVFTRHLAQRLQTIAPDLRGYGNSRIRQTFEMTDHLVDLDALLDRLQVKRCLILGWSLGGILGIELALKLPERISGLILVASAARPRGSHPPISWEDNVYTGIASILNRLHPGWQWNIDAFGKRSLYRYLIQQHTPESYRYLAEHGIPAYLQTSAAAEQALSKAIRAGYNRLPDLNTVNCPCLVLAGAEDRHITAQSSLETAQHLNNCQFHAYPGVAHLFPWEIPNQVLRDIDHWIKNHPQAIGKEPSDSKPNFSVPS